MLLSNQSLDSMVGGVTERLAFCVTCYGIDPRTVKIFVNLTGSCSVV